MASRAIALVLLLCALGSVVLSVRAVSPDAGIEDTAAAEPVSSAQLCYTLDTSRPEWLVRFIYLPLLLKGDD